VGAKKTLRCRPPFVARESRRACRPGGLGGGEGEEMLNPGRKPSLGLLGLGASACSAWVAEVSSTRFSTTAANKM
jgi:hypothetical protein